MQSKLLKSMLAAIPSRAGTINALCHMMEQFLSAGDTEAADILWQAALRMRDLSKPGPSKMPLQDKGRANA